MLPSGNDDGVGPNVQRHTYNPREILIVPVLTHDVFGYVGSGHALARAAWRNSRERDVSIVPKADLNTQARTWSAAPSMTPKGQVRRQHREDAETGFSSKIFGFNDALDKRRELMEAWAFFCFPMAAEVVAIADRRKRS